VVWPPAVLLQRQAGRLSAPAGVSSTLLLPVVLLTCTAAEAGVRGCHVCLAPVECLYDWLLRQHQGAGSVCSVLLVSFERIGGCLAKGLAHGPWCLLHAARPVQRTAAMQIRCLWFSSATVVQLVTCERL
jgi:hypothetical protein